MKNPLGFPHYADAFCLPARGSVPHLESVKTLPTSSLIYPCTREATYHQPLKTSHLSPALGGLQTALRYRPAAPHPARNGPPARRGRPERQGPQGQFLSHPGSAGQRLPPQQPPLAALGGHHARYCQTGHQTFRSRTWLDLPRPRMDGGQHRRQNIPPPPATAGRRTGICAKNGAPAPAPHFADQRPGDRQRGAPPAFRCRAGHRRPDETLRIGHHHQKPEQKCPLPGRLPLFAGAYGRGERGRPDAAVAATHHWRDHYGYLWDSAVPGGGDYQNGHPRGDSGWAD